DRAPSIFVASSIIFEAGMVLSSKLSRDARPLIRDLLRRMDARVVDFTDDHADIAVSAFLRYGKGRHPAALNFGDCMAYAVARLSGLPLLFTGDDFSKTDIEAA